VFKNCLVIYRGGPINLILAWKGELAPISIGGKPSVGVSLSGNALEFEKCLFQFTVQGVPSPTGREVTESLLAQNSDTLTLPHP
jgi:hypothetical protein